MVYWCSPFYKCKSRYRLVVFGAMRYYIFTVDVGVGFFVAAPYEWA